jgi:hypothetical protein
MTTASVLHKGRGYYPVMFRVAFDPHKRNLEKQAAQAKRAHKGGTAHHAVYCALCQDGHCTVCDPQITWKGEHGCLVGNLPPRDYHYDADAECWYS